MKPIAILSILLLITSHSHAMWSLDGSNDDEHVKAAKQIIADNPLVLDFSFCNSPTSAPPQAGPCEDSSDDERQEQHIPDTPSTKKRKPGKRVPLSTLPQAARSHYEPIPIEDQVECERWKNKWGLPYSLKQRMQQYRENIPGYKKNKTVFRRGSEIELDINLIYEFPEIVQAYVDGMSEEKALSIVEELFKLERSDALSSPQRRYIYDFSTPHAYFAYCEKRDKSQKLYKIPSFRLGTTEQLAKYYKLFTENKLTPNDALLKNCDPNVGGSLLTSRMASLFINEADYAAGKVTHEYRWITSKQS